MRNLFPAITTVVCLLAACSSPDGRVAGSSSRVGNAFGVTGTVTTVATGDAASGAKATLFSITATDSGRYDWYVLDSMVTDTGGGFLFERVPDGYYSVVLEQDALKAFSGYFRYLTEDTLLDLGAVVLDSTVTVSGAVAVKDTLDFFGFSVGIIGTSRKGVRFTGTNFTIDEIPHGIFKITVGLYKVGSNVEIDNGVVTLPLNGGSDSIFYSGYNDLPIPNSQQDTVTILEDTISVSGQDYDIEFVTY